MKDDRVVTSATSHSRLGDLRRKNERICIDAGELQTKISGHSCSPKSPSRRVLGSQVAEEVFKRELQRNANTGEMVVVRS